MLLLDPTADFYECISKFEQKAVMTDANRKKPIQEVQIRPRQQKIKLQSKRPNSTI